MDVLYLMQMPQTAQFQNVSDLDPIIDFKDISVYRGKALLKDVNWQVKPGEHWAVLGANGSGKSTMLNVLSAFTGPATGEMRVLGKKFGKDRWDQVKLQIGFVSATVQNLIEPSEPVIWALVGGRHAMINFWGEALQEELDEAREILEHVECGHLVDALWCQLSQGEKQKVLIGRALMARIKLLILDEPCAGLDPVARVHFLDFLERSASRENAPSHILVTHHVEEITRSFTHVLLLHKGKVYAQGTREEVLTSENLSRIFNAKLELLHTRAGMALRIHDDSHSFGQEDL